MSTISSFMEMNFRHFNARETLDAAKAWKKFIEDGGQMLLAMAGAMSTAELGITLAQMIRQGKIHAVSATAANLEEDIFNLFHHHDYKLVPKYRDLSPREELALRDQGFNRVTDTCIPESVMVRVEDLLIKHWQAAEAQGIEKFPWEFCYAILEEPGIEEYFTIPREHSWVLAAKEMGIPIITPGWEDSTMGNKFAALVIEGRLKSHRLLRTGTEQMEYLAKWYSERAEKKIPVGFFQIGGGIAGDFPISTVPMLIQDLDKTDMPFWAYYAQIGDSVTSYGSYSGAVPSEKITWYKLDLDSPKFMINSDATIVAPLIFSYVLGH